MMSSLGQSSNEGQEIELEKDHNEAWHLAVWQLTCIEKSSDRPHEGNRQTGQQDPSGVYV
jgi:hypothetical protein